MPSTQLQRFQVDIAPTRDAVLHLEMLAKTFSCKLMKGTMLFGTQDNDATVLVMLNFNLSKNMSNFEVTK